MITKIIDDIKCNQESLLIIPINPFYYYIAECEVASPYIFRFQTDLNEIISYTDVHPYKEPDKVLIIKDRMENEEIITFENYY